MQAFTDVGYTKNLSYMCKHLVGFSRLNYKLQTLNTNTASNGNIITVDLPSNAMVDLKTLTMFLMVAQLRLQGLLASAVTLNR